ICLALATDRNGESLAALEALRKTLDAVGLDHHDLAAAIQSGLSKQDIERPQPADRPQEPAAEADDEADDDDGWRATAWAGWKQVERLSERDRDFLEVILSYQHQPSEKQRKWLANIRDRLAQTRRAS